MAKWKKYKVKKGKHSSVKFGYKIFWGKRSLDFKFKVDESWFWENKNGVSKVYGISSGMHHKDSMRLGFRCVDGVPTAYAYSYADGNRKYTKLCGLTVGEFICRISVEDGEWVIRMSRNGGSVFAEERHPFGRAMVFGFRLYPYVGGTYTLDHDWNVEIKEL